MNQQFSLGEKAVQALGMGVISIAAASESCVVSPVTEESENLSEVLVRISIALQGLGWSREQGVPWERYGVKSSHYLTPVQLLDWLSYLSGMG